MRTLFVYEFVSGGGFAGEALPPRLLSEGRAMLEALLADLAHAGGRRIVTTLDDRVSLEPPPGVEVVRIYPGTGLASFRALAAAADDAWLIAPETGGRLAALAERAEELGARLIGASSAAIRFAGDKLHLVRRMAEAGIPVPRTWPAGEAGRALEEVGFPLVVKPAVGAGCEGVGVAEDSGELVRLLRTAASTGQAIVQEYIEGTPASACVLCGSGRPRALSLNGQSVTMGPSFSYTGGRVPLHHPLADDGTALAVAACEVVPGLAGFVGVDLVLSRSGPVLIEINPRLTTSYVGLRAATDLNLAKLIMGGAKRVDSRFPLPLRSEVEFTAAGRVRVLAERSEAHRRPPTGDRPPTTTADRPTTTADRPTTTDDRPPTTDHRRPPTDHRRPTTDDRRPTTRRPRTAGPRAIAGPSSADERVE